MERVAKKTAVFKWLIIGSVKAYLDAIKHTLFEKIVGNLSSSYVVGLLHDLFKVILLTISINVQRVNEKLCVCHAICSQRCSV